MAGFLLVSLWIPLRRGVYHFENLLFQDFASAIVIHQGFALFSEKKRILGCLERNAPESPFRPNGSMRCQRVDNPFFFSTGGVGFIFRYPFEHNPRNWCPPF